MTRESRSWDFGDLDGYIREGEPGRKRRADNWQTAIGLQAVDGLSTSDYLLDTAKKHIEGHIDIDEAQRRIDSYYEERSDRGEVEGSSEADRVSARIAKLLGESAFTFSPVQLQTIHRRLFDKVLPQAGQYRTYNITKSEWVLKGETVLYASHDSIEDTLRYDFAQEHGFSYVGLAQKEVARHLARFVAGIWQIHPFGEGNTRTTAVFVIKYLRAMGYKVDNEPFKRHSWYFRNALVRANYEDVTKGVSPTTTYLERFFDNLLCAEQYELKNRYLHLDWHSKRTDGVCAVCLPTTTPKRTPTTQETTQEHIPTTQESIMSLLEANPSLSARQLSEGLGISFDGVRYHLARLRKTGIIRHEGPTKGGRWVVSR